MSTTNTKFEFLKRILSDHTGRLDVGCLRAIKNRIDYFQHTNAGPFLALTRILCNEGDQEGVCFHLGQQEIFTFVATRK